MTPMASHKRPRIFTHAHRQRLERAAEVYLRQCYREKAKVSVAAFATLIKRNPEYMTRTTTNIAGMSLLDYLRTKQLQEAERLLRTTPLLVEEIAVCAGFGTASTLYRCFRRYRGMSPSQFREVRNCETK